jgi:hypothetical protein
MTAPELERMFPSLTVTVKGGVTCFLGVSVVGLGMATVEAMVVKRLGDFGEENFRGSVWYVVFLHDDGV